MQDIKMPCPRCGQWFDAAAIKTHDCKPAEPVTLRKQLTNLYSRLADVRKQKVEDEAERLSIEAELGRFVGEHPIVMGPIIEVDVSDLVDTAQRLIHFLGRWDDDTLRTIDRVIPMPPAPPEFFRNVRKMRRAIARLKMTSALQVEEWDKAMSAPIETEKAA